MNAAHNTNHAHAHATRMEGKVVFGAPTSSRCVVYSRSYGGVDQEVDSYGLMAARLWHERGQSGEELALL